MRRRLYLMRHGAVAYFDDDGRPVPEDDVPLTSTGREQAEAARALLDGVDLDRVIVSGLPRTAQTAAVVAPGHAAETWPDLRELKGAKLAEIPLDEREEAFVHAFRGVVPNEKRFWAARASASSSTASCRPSSASSPTRSGTPFSSSPMAPSTARSSHTR